MSEAQPTEEAYHIPVIFLGWPLDTADAPPDLKPVVIAYILADGSIIREVHQMNQDGFGLPEDMHYTAGVTSITRRNSHGTCPEISHDMVEPTAYFSHFDTKERVDFEIRYQLLAPNEIPRQAECFIFIEEASLFIETSVESLIIGNVPENVFREVMEEVFGSDL